MHVFISWSGQKSMAYAEELKRLSQNCIQSIDVFCSSTDIHNGDNWVSVLFEQLGNTKYGIVCVTKENMNSPWINFEAGAIANKLENKITTLLIDNSNVDPSQPLSLYQATRLDKKSLQNMIISINETLESKIDRNRILESFEHFYDIFEGNTDSFSFEQKNSEDYYKILKEILQIVKSNDVLLNEIDRVLPSICEEVENIKSTDFKDKYNKICDKFFNLLYYISNLDDAVYRNVNERIVIRRVLDCFEECFKSDKRFMHLCNQRYMKVEAKYKQYDYVVHKTK